VGCRGGWGGGKRECGPREGTLFGPVLSWASSTGPTQTKGSFFPIFLQLGGGGGGCSACVVKFLFVGKRGRLERGGGGVGGQIRGRISFSKRQKKESSDKKIQIRMAAG